MFKVKHAWRQFWLDKIGDMRLHLKEGSKFDLWLERKALVLLDKQMADRKKQGIVEIEPHVEWGFWGD